MDFRRAGLSPALSLLMSTFSLPNAPPVPHRPPQSDKGRQALRSVTSSWPRNINLVPIDYAFRPRLRGRLTLLRLALSRNPWTFGERVSHPLCRYSCQHSRFRTLHRCLTARLRRRDPYLRSAPKGAEEAGSTERNAPLPRAPCGAHPELRLVA